MFYCVIRIVLKRICNGIIQRLFCVFYFHWIFFPIYAIYQPELIFLSNSNAIPFSVIGIFSSNYRPNL